MAGAGVVDVEALCWRLDRMDRQIIYTILSVILYT